MILLYIKNVNKSRGRAGADYWLCGYVAKNYVAMLQKSVDDILRLKNKPYLASFLVKCRTKIRQLLLKTKPHIENSIYQHTFRARNYSL